MDLQILLDLLGESGYPGLFLWILLGSSTLPVPNEVMMLTVGLAASQKSSTILPLFFTALASVLSALTASYLLGMFIGRPLLGYLSKKERFSKKIASSMQLMDKHHAFSLSISYFLPGIRTVVPFLYGFSRLPFRTFAAYSYTGASAWLLIMFTAGFLFGENINVISAYATEIIVGLVVLLALVFGSVRSYKKKHSIGDEEEALLASPLSAIQKSSSE